MITIMKLINEIESYCFLSHCRIVPGIKQLIEIIYVSLTENSYEYNKYHMIIADFMKLIMEKIQIKPYIYDLLCSNSKHKDASKCSSNNQDINEITFIPLKICVFLLKQSYPLDKSGLLFKITSTIKPMILRNNKEILEISDVLMRKLDSIYCCLPSSLVTMYNNENSSISTFLIFGSNQSYYNTNEVFDIKRQIELTCNKGAVHPVDYYLQAFENFMNYIEFLDQLMFSFKNERLVDHMVNSLFNEFLLKHVQDALLDNINYQQYRTCIQYLICMLHNMKHQKVTEIMFSFLFGFSSEDKSETDQNSYNIDMNLINSQQFISNNIEYDFENQNIDPFEYRNSKDELENYEEFENRIGSNQKGDSGNINSNNSSNNRGPFVPLLNLNVNQCFENEYQKPKQIQNIIVTSSSDNSDQIEGGMPMDDYADLNEEYNENDIFGDTRSRRSFDPKSEIAYKAINKIESNPGIRLQNSSRSEYYERKLDSLVTDDEDTKDEVEDKNDLLNKEQNLNQNEYKPYNPNQYFETINKLNQDGFFDKEEIEEFEICKVKTEKHHPITLCRRIICGVGSTVEHVSPITLKLIDLFAQKDRDLQMVKSYNY